MCVYVDQLEVNNQQMGHELRHIQSVHIYIYIYYLSAYENSTMLNFMCRETSYTNILFSHVRTSRNLFRLNGAAIYKLNGSY